MENFVFSSRAKTVTLGFGILGVICLLATYLLYPESHHMRFWTNFLHNSVFFLGIALISGFVLAAFTTAYAGWYVNFKRVWESMSLWMLPALATMLVLIIGLVTKSHHLYHWNDPEAVLHDAILTHKSAFLNQPWYIGGTLIFGGIWYFFISRMRSISVDEDTNGGDANFSHHRKYRKYAAVFLPIVGFTSAAMIWQWIMSMDSHWYSTMFAWYATASWFLGMMSLTIMLMIYLKSRGYFPQVTFEHFHDLGKWMFAISIFWMYVWFSQYMLIWYANIGEETIYFRERLDNYTVLFWANLIMNFLLPLLILMRNDTKRKYGTLFFVAALVFVGHWVDFFQMIKPAARITIDEHSAHDSHGDEHSYDLSSAILERNEQLASTDNSFLVDQHDNDQAGHEEAGHEEGTEHHGEEHADEHGDAAHADDHSQDETGHHEDDHADDHAAAGAHGDDHSAGHGDGHGGVDPRNRGFKAGYTLPGFWEIGTFLGFLGFFLYFTLGRLASASLLPKNDPYMVEADHHHT